MPIGGIPHEVCQKETVIAELVAWQSRQNGSLQRLEDRFDRLAAKLDRLTYSVLGLMASIIGGLTIYILTHP